MTIRILYCGVDTLEATFDGTLHDDLPAKLDAAKALAQATDTPVRFELAGETLYVSGRGLGKYAWVLTNSRMHVRVSRAKAGLPVVSIRLLADALATYGHVELYRQACIIVADLGQIVPNTLSRIDLAADLHGFEMTDAEFANLVCAASYTAIHKDGDGVTYQIGKGDAVLRIYRKDAHLRAKNKLSYAKVWERCPDYDPSAPVWRIEIQLRGSILKELGSRNVLTAFTKLARLFQFGLSWCELRVPGTDTTKKRWPVDERWRHIAASWGGSAPEPRMRQASHMEREERVISRLVGAAASLGAYSGQSELIDVLIYAQVRMESNLKDKGRNFEELVEEKTARIGCEEEVAF